MSARAAVPTDLPAVAAVFRGASAAPSRGIVSSVLPFPYVAAIGDRMTLLRSAFSLHPRARLFVEGAGALRAAALVFVARRPEWVVLLVAARPDPDGAEGAFRLVSAVSAAAARAGAERLYAAVPDEPIARETFFQAGFYSYTTETWYVARRALELAERSAPFRPARPADATDLFRLYLRTTPNAVRRAEQLSISDFDLERGAPALLPPHLVDGNPLAMRRGPVLVIEDDRGGLKGIAAAFHGQGAHPHVCALHATGEVDLTRELMRRIAGTLDRGRPIACPVRPYDEGVARVLEGEGFGAVRAVMLFVKELALRAEEPALAVAPVR